MQMYSRFHDHLQKAGNPESYNSPTFDCEDRLEQKSKKADQTLRLGTQGNIIGQAIIANIAPCLQAGFNSDRVILSENIFPLVIRGPPEFLECKHSIRLNPHES